MYNLCSSKVQRLSLIHGKTIWPMCVIPPHLGKNWIEAVWVGVVTLYAKAVSL